MKLTFEDERTHAYPNGYWYATTDKGGYDADGPDPLTAITRLAQALEEELDEDEESVLDPLIQTP